MKSKPILYDQGLHYLDLHEDHKNWLIELEFCKGEIIFFQSILEDFADKNNDPEKMLLVEQFQNKFLLENKTIEIYSQEILNEEERLKEFIKTHSENIEFITFSDHKDRRSKMATYRRLFAELKKEFYQFITFKN